MTWPAQLRLMFLAALLLACGGCVSAPEKARIVYAPRELVSPIPGSEGACVRVTMNEGRSGDLLAVGYLAAGIGGERSRILALEPANVTASKALELELANSGFTLGAGGAIVRAELTFIFCKWKKGTRSNSAISKFSMRVEVVPENGNRIYYTKLISAEGENASCGFMSGLNAEVALSSALTKGIHQLFSDPAYIQAIIEAGSLVEISPPALPEDDSSLNKPPEAGAGAEKLDEPVDDGSLATSKALTRFERLKSLRAEKLISEEEYESERKRIAESMLKEVMQ